MKAATLSKHLKSKHPPCVVDVRSGLEYKSGHIPGALNLPVSTLLLKRRQLPQDRQSLLVLTCEHGPRAVLAKGILNLCGYKNCELLEGHMLGYRRAGLPLDS